MSSFSYPVSARQWFQHILGSDDTGFSLDFDFYYYCLLAGLVKERKNPELTSKETHDFIRNFPTDYVPQMHFIIALFLKTELNNQGIKLAEKKALDKELSRLLDPNSATRLSDEGMKALNQYCYGGFELLQKHFEEPPRTLDSFLISFYKFLNEDSK